MLSLVLASSVSGTRPTRSVNRAQLYKDHGACCYTLSLCMKLAVLWLELKHKTRLSAQLTNILLDPGKEAGDHPKEGRFVHLRPVLHS